MTGFEAEWRARFERFARTHSDEASISGVNRTMCVRTDRTGNSFSRGASSCKVAPFAEI